MQLVEGRLVLSPTDLTKHLACPHVTTLDQQVAEGRLGPPPAPDADLGATLAAVHGTGHEKAYLESLRADGLSIVEIAPALDAAGRRAAEAQTLDAMRAGADVVYQASFMDDRWGGQADFLLRTEQPSGLGNWSYDIADTKLARSLKVPALLQMATYAERLTVLQGTAPTNLYVVTGDGERRPWRLLDVSAYARRARVRLERALRDRPVTEAVPVSHCRHCRWSVTCEQGWQAADDVTQVAFLRADHRLALREAGVGTVGALAAAIGPAPMGIGPSAWERMTGQARLQVAERVAGTPSYDLLPPQAGFGLLRLPEPDPGDVYLDFEGDPFAEDGEGREYLAGIGDRHGGFQTVWAHSRAEESELIARLVDLLLARWRAHPGMHVYHYAPYETSALKRLTGRYGVREAELDQLLRGERFVDLYAVVRQGLQISKPSYSIKYLEHFYWGHVRQDGAVSDGLGSDEAYERWLVEHNPAILAQLEAYNRVDVESTAALHRWLEERRDELGPGHGLLPRPGVAQALPVPMGEAELAEIELADRLRVAGAPLLAGLVQWHRREGRPRWWDIFRLKDLDLDQLERDRSVIGGLSAPEAAGTDKRSTLWRYTFAPQDTKVAARKGVLDVDTAAGVGSVFDIEPVEGWVVLKVGPDKPAPRPRGLSPEGPPNDQVLRASIADTASRTLAGLDCPGQRLLDRVVPAGLPVRPEESPQDAVVRIGRELSGEVLAVQGPPGSGKTTVGARLIRALLDDGKRVGVTASSHQVIGNLLREVGRPALQRCTPEDHCEVAGVAIARDNEEVLDRLVSGEVQLAGGTAWLWARPEMREAVDVLVVDEAGQFSLANAVAVAPSARSLVLLGDPQQLSQPTQAQHPDGAGMSALGHLIGEEHDTIAPQAGVFLDRSWRMHPEITAFVSDLAYESRLAAAPCRERQAVRTPGSVGGSGLRFVPVKHSGNSAGSDEEVTVVAGLVVDLMAGTWTDLHGVAHRMSLEDILVVTPYNNQVGRLRHRLPPGARIGTVDKFQGQQAPVVVYSMASSSAEDAPRGVGFLYDVHRLNVAISRAQALAVIVASPRLLDAAVRSPEQLRKVNALCRYVEVAGSRGT